MGPYREVILSPPYFIIVTDKDVFGIRGNLYRF